MLKTQPYRGILYFLLRNENKGIKRIHLRFLLFENHNIKVINAKGKLTKKGRELKKIFGRYVIDNPQKIIDHAKRFSKSRGHIHCDGYSGFILPRQKGLSKTERNNSAEELNKFLIRLLEMEPELVYKHPEKKTYHLTDKGRNIIIREFVYWFISQMPEAALEEFAWSIINKDKRALF